MKNRSNYPANWNDQIRPEILKRDKYKCQKCGANHRATGYYNKGSFVVCDDSFSINWAKKNNFKTQTLFLQIAHLDQNTNNNDYSNLQSMCPKCHLAYDKSFNLIKRLMKKRT